MKNYDEASCLKSLRRKKSINIQSNRIMIEADNCEVGNGSWGKIDYLCNYCGYIWFFVTSAKGKSPKKKNTDSYDTELDNVPQNNKNEFSVSKLIKKFKHK